MNQSVLIISDSLFLKSSFNRNIKYFLIFPVNQIKIEVDILKIEYLNLQNLYICVNTE